MKMIMIMIIINNSINRNVEKCIIDKIKKKKRVKIYFLYLH
jgi:hypothetical protein